MPVQFRSYTSPDYQLVSSFLTRHHRPSNADGNWLEPAWEYMHHHPMLDESSLRRIGLWEDSGELVGVAHYESTLGEAFFQLHPAYGHLRELMLDHAEANFATPADDSGTILRAYVNDFDLQFTAIVAARGYVHDPHRPRPMYALPIPRPFPSIPLRDGFRLMSLADEPDWGKVHRVLWRGFDHGEVPAYGQEDLDSRRKMFDTPRARRDLKIAVVAPDGEFVAFCGMFLDEMKRFAYVEPVATDPAYRRMGLGRAAVLEGIRRCGELGATTAYVGSGQPFYQSLGFRRLFHAECWVKRSA